MVEMCGFLRRAFQRWRARCPFVRRLEEWRMKRKAREFRLE
ncbi:hypothetical protein [Thermococcus sp. 21S9]|nr:hypothetical protein [Thermococcus sp. 21S9]